MPEAVHGIGTLLAGQRFDELAALVDLEGSGLAIAALVPAVFLRPAPHGGPPELTGVWWPFEPGSRYVSHVELGEVALVEVARSIDQGDGTIVRQPPRVAMFRHGDGWRPLAAFAETSTLADVIGRVDPGDPETRAKLVALTRWMVPELARTVREHASRLARDPRMLGLVLDVLWVSGRRDDVEAAATALVYDAFEAMLFSRDDSGRGGSTPDGAAVALARTLAALSPPVRELALAAVHAEPDRARPSDHPYTSIDVRWMCDAVVAALAT